MISPSLTPYRRNSPGFTLVEMLVSIVIVILLVGMMLSISGSVNKTWHYANLKIEEFKQSRQAFSTMTQRLSQATLNTYWGYNNPSNPQYYIRLSELRFISGPWNGQGSPPGPQLTNGDPADYPTHAVFFQAPIGYTANSDYQGLNHLLNTWGYYIEFGSDQTSTPTFFQSLSYYAPRYRYRLMEMMEPSEDMTLYKHTSGYKTVPPPTTGSVLNCENYTTGEWYQDALNLSPVPAHVLAENVIALILSPQISPTDVANGGPPFVYSIAPNYSYNSHQSTTSISTGTTTGSTAKSTTQNDLPPTILVTMVAIDESSAQRLAAQNGTNPPTAISNAMAGLFTQAINYQSDLTALEDSLTKANVNYRVFTLNIKLPNSTFNGLLQYSGN